MWSSHPPDGSTARSSGRPLDRFLWAVRELRVAGRIVFVHSSFKSMRCLETEPIRIVQLLCELVGEDGTLVMPVYPMAGLSQAYLDSRPTFDWHHTPSRTGLLSELLRGLPGAERSLHPTHSVAAYGALAVWLTDGHERSTLPFDEYSPFQKMYDRDAVALNLGVRLMTFRHLADHLLREELPHPVYVDRVTRARLIDREGREHWMETRGHNPRYRVDYTRVVREMQRGGEIKGVEAGGVFIELVPVRSFVRAYMRSYRSGEVLFIDRSDEPGEDPAEGRPVPWP